MTAEFYYCIYKIPKNDEIILIETDLSISKNNQKLKFLIQFLIAYVSSLAAGFGILNKLETVDSVNSVQNSKEVIELVLNLPRSGEISEDEKFFKLLENLKEKTSTDSFCSRSFNKKLIFILKQFDKIIGNKNMWVIMSKLEQPLNPTLGTTENQKIPQILAPKNDFVKRQMKAEIETLKKEGIQRQKAKIVDVPREISARMRHFNDFKQILKEEAKQNSLALQQKLKNQTKAGFISMKKNETMRKTSFFVDAFTAPSLTFNQHQKLSHLFALPDVSVITFGIDNFQANLPSNVRDHIVVKHGHQWGINQIDVFTTVQANKNRKEGIPIQIRTTLNNRTRQQIIQRIQQVASQLNLEVYSNYPINKGIGRAYLDPETNLFMGIDENAIIRKAYPASEGLINFLQTNCNDNNSENE